METKDNKDHDKKYYILYIYITETVVSIFLLIIFALPLFPLHLSLAGERVEAKIVEREL